MAPTGLVYHSDCLKHLPLEGKPERPERVSATMEHLRMSGVLEKLHLITPEPASEADLERVHTEELINYVRETSEKGYEENALINGDIFIGPDTYDCALLASGGVKKAAEAVWEGDVESCFALVRPPGHHASRNLPAGYCYFNNTAVAIRSLQEKHGIGRVAVFDWDAHCGHGTMGVFYDDPDVLTISIHQDPKNFYPGTGFVEQTGEGEGKGFCMNLPVPAGTGDPDYIKVIDEFVIPKMTRFNPEIIFVAAGQDSHRDDGISGLKLTDDGFAAMTARMQALAKKLCEGMLVMTLEGGYNVQTLPETNARIISTLCGEGPPAISGKPLDSTARVIAQLKQQLAGTPMGD